MFLLQVSTCESREDIQNVCRQQTALLTRGLSKETLLEVKKSVRESYKLKYKAKLAKYKSQIEALTQEDQENRQVIAEQENLLYRADEEREQLHAQCAELTADRNSLQQITQQSQSFIEQADLAMRQNLERLREECGLLQMQCQEYKSIIATQKDLIHQLHHAVKQDPNMFSFAHQANSPWPSQPQPQSKGIIVEGADIESTISMTLTTLEEKEQKADCLSLKWKKASLRHEKSKEN